MFESKGGAPRDPREIAEHPLYGQFSKFHVCFCGLDSGNFKFDSTDT